MSLLLLSSGPAVQQPSGRDVGIQTPLSTLPGLRAQGPGSRVHCKVGPSLGHTLQDSNQVEWDKETSFVLFILFFCGWGSLCSDTSH